MTDHKKPADPPLLFEPTLKQRTSFERWVSERAPEIAEEIRDRKLEPWRIYRLKATGERVTIIAILEPVSGGRGMKLSVLSETKFNPKLNQDYEIENVPPEDLEPCAPPSQLELAQEAESADAPTVH